MRCILAAALAAALLPSAATAEGAPPEGPAARAGYSLGHQIGADLAGRGQKVESDALGRGLADGLGGGEPTLAPDQIVETLKQLTRQIHGDAEPEGGAPASADAEKLGYSIGYQVGLDFRRQGIEIDADQLLRGTRDALAGADPALGPEAMRETLVALQKEAVARAEAQRAQRASVNLAAGEAFLTENGKKDGISTLPSGMQYRVITAGEGEPPAARDTVTVHYRGTLIDGTEFDSSYGRGEPATFPLNRVIPGWTEGLQLMRPGAKYRLYIPPQLAYGERGAGARIEPNATLVFDVELLSVKRSE